MKSKNKDSFWGGRRAFITGATGFLGSCLARRLCSLGAEVTVLIRDRVPLSNFYLQGLHRLTDQVMGSLEDYELIKRAISDYRCEVVFHLGAQTIVSTAYNDPISTFKSNIQGTWNMLEAVRHLNSVKALVVASSDKAYGEQLVLPTDESKPLSGSFTYDVSKSCQDMLSTAFHRTYALPVAITRCANLYGGGDLNFNRLIPETIAACIKGQIPIIRSDGSYLREYLYIEDAIDGYLALGEAVWHGKHHGEAFNMGVGEPHSVRQVVEKIMKLTNRKGSAEILNQATTEIKRQHLDSTKAKRLLDWSAKTDLESGLRATVEWYRWFFELTEQRKRELCQ